MRLELCIFFSYHMGWYNFYHIYQLWLYINILSIHSSIHWVTLYITEQSTGPSIYFQCHQYTAAAATVKSFAYLLTRISTHTATCGSVIFHPKFHTSGTQSFLYNLKNEEFYKRHHLIMAKTPYAMNTSTFTVLRAICKKIHWLVNDSYAQYCDLICPLNCTVQHHCTAYDFSVTQLLHL